MVMICRKLVVGNTTIMRMAGSLLRMAMMVVTTRVLVSRYMSVVLARTRSLQRMQTRMAQEGRGAMQEKQQAGCKKSHCQFDNKEFGPNLIP